MVMHKSTRIQAKCKE